MEEIDERQVTERFLDGMIKAWELSFNSRRDGNGQYLFNRGRLLKLRKVQRLIKVLKAEKKELIKEKVNISYELITELKKSRNKISRMKGRGDGG